MQPNVGPPSGAPGTSRDTHYVELLLDPLKASARYKPMFGKGKLGGTSLGEFHALYGADPLYHWVGLDSDLMYATHKAAGGMTSIYRQLGIGCERLFRAIVQDTLSLTDQDVKWGYEVRDREGKVARLTLDARIDAKHVGDVDARLRISDWVREVAKRLGHSDAKARSLTGAVFEVRQGYKSADSKRQNADLRNGVRAYSEDYLPVILVMSSQISGIISRRYANAQLLILVGDRSGSALTDTFAFCRDVVGYPLDDFFVRNTARLQEEFTEMLRKLLSPG